MNYESTATHICAPRNRLNELEWVAKCTDGDAQHDPHRISVNIVIYLRCTYKYIIAVYNRSSNIWRNELEQTCMFDTWRWYLHRFTPFAHRHWEREREEEGQSGRRPHSSQTKQEIWDAIKFYLIFVPPYVSVDTVSTRNIIIKSLRIWSDELFFILIWFVVAADWNTFVCFSISARFFFSGFIA